MDLNDPTDPAGDVGETLFESERLTADGAYVCGEWDEWGEMGE